MRAVLVMAMFVSGCLKEAAFECTSDPQCTRGGTQGTCEAVGFCSFPDRTCASGRRFGDVSGMYTQRCVGDHEGGADVAIDGGFAVPDGLECPVGYAILTGAPDHAYRRISTAAAWQNQVTACRDEGANVYLAIPDSETELRAILTFASSDVWVGISDVAVEASYVTVHDTVPGFLPWAAGQPDDSGGGSDCVQALSASATYDDRRCSNSVIAVCECEP
jgi:hypothetical protein